MVLESDLVDTLDQYVLDQHIPVTYFWLARELDLSADAAKEILLEYGKQKNSLVQISFVVSGVISSVNGIKRRSVVITAQENLEKTKAAFAEVTSLHVYSVQDHEPKDARDYYCVSLVQTDKLVKTDGARSSVGMNKSGNIEFSLDVIKSEKKRPKSPSAEIIMPNVVAKPERVSESLTQSQTQSQKQQDTKKESRIEAEVEQKPAIAAKASVGIGSFFTKGKQIPAEAEKITPTKSSVDTKTSPTSHNSKQTEGKKNVSNWFNRIEPQTQTSVAEQKTDTREKSDKMQINEKKKSEKESNVETKKRIRRIHDSDDEEGDDSQSVTVIRDDGDSQILVQSPAPTPPTTKTTANIHKTASTPENKKASQKLDDSKHNETSKANKTKTPEKMDTSESAKESPVKKTQKPKKNDVILIVDDERDSKDNADDDFMDDFEPPVKSRKVVKVKKAANTTADESESPQKGENAKKKSSASDVSPKKTKSAKGKKEAVAFIEEGHTMDEENEDVEESGRKASKSKTPKSGGGKQSDKAAKEAATPAISAIFSAPRSKPDPVEDAPPQRMKSVVVTESFIDEKGYKVRKQVTKLVPDDSPIPVPAVSKTTDSAKPAPESTTEPKSKAEAATPATKKPAKAPPANAAAQRSIASFFKK